MLHYKKILYLFWRHLPGCCRCQSVMPRKLLACSYLSWLSKRVVIVSDRKTGLSFVQWCGLLSVFTDIAIMFLTFHKGSHHPGRCWAATTARNICNQKHNQVLKIECTLLNMSTFLIWALLFACLARLKVFFWQVPTFSICSLILNLVLKSFCHLMKIQNTSVPILYCCWHCALEIDATFQPNCGCISLEINVTKHE